MVFVSQFEYNNELSDDWDLEICTFDHDGTETTSSGLELSPAVDELVNRSVDYGARNGEPITFEMTLVHRNESDRYFGRDEIRELTGWLLTPNVHWLKLYDQEYDDYWCLGRFTKIAKTKFGGNIPALTLTFVSVSSYYYSDLIRKTFSVDGNARISIWNHGDEIEGYMYPDMEITMKEEGDVSIKNLAEEEPFSLSNLSDSEIITIDGHNLIMYSNKTGPSPTPKIFGDHFNRHWVKLYKGENILEAAGHFDLTFKYREARRVGEF